MGEIPYIALADNEAPARRAEMLMEMKPRLLGKRMQTFPLAFFVLCEAKTHTDKLADAHNTHTYKGAGSTGGHPSYGKHS